jgi:hypothetical protein
MHERRPGIPILLPGNLLKARGESFFRKFGMRGMKNFYASDVKLFA